jgi:uncharacterized protein YaaR (DUF327 family)
MMPNLSRKENSINMNMTILEQFNNANIDPNYALLAEQGIRQRLNQLNQEGKLNNNPFYSEVDIEVLVYRYLQELLDKIIRMKSNTNLYPTTSYHSITDIVSIALNEISEEINKLGNALDYTVTETKACKNCGVMFKDDDEFCSPECLENYMKEELKKKDLP